MFGKWTRSNHWQNGIQWKLVHFYFKTFILHQHKRTLPQKVEEIYSHGESHVSLTLKSQAMYFFGPNCNHCPLLCSWLWSSPSPSWSWPLPFLVQMFLIMVITFYYALQTINLLIIIVVFSCAFNCGCCLLRLDHIRCLLLCS